MISDPAYRTTPVFLLLINIIKIRQLTLIMIDAGFVGIYFVHHPVLRWRQLGHYDISAAHETEFTTIGFVEAGQRRCAGYVCLRADKTRKSNNLVSHSFGVRHLIIWRSARQRLPQRSFGMRNEWADADHVEIQLTKRQDVT